MMAVYSIKRRNWGDSKVKKLGRGHTSRKQYCQSLWYPTTMPENEGKGGDWKRHCILKTPPGSSSSDLGEEMDGMSHRRRLCRCRKVTGWLTIFNNLVYTDRWAETGGGRTTTITERDEVLGWNHDTFPQWRCSSQSPMWFQILSPLWFSEGLSISIVPRMLSFGPLQLHNHVMSPSDYKQNLQKNQQWDWKEHFLHTKRKEEVELNEEQCWARPWRDTSIANGPGWSRTLQTI